MLLKAIKIGETFKHRKKPHFKITPKFKVMFLCNTTILINIYAGYLTLSPYFDIVYVVKRLNNFDAHDIRFKKEDISK